MDMKEIDRRIKLGVRNITISPLFEKDKLYSLHTQKEDNEGTLRPVENHCWLTWQSKWFDKESGEYKWSNEAYSFQSLEKAEEAKKYLEKHIFN